MNISQNGSSRARILAAASALVVMAASVGALVSTTVRAEVPQGRKAAAEHQAPPISPGKVAPLAGLQDAFTAIADRLEPSLVSIRVKKVIHTTSLEGEDGINNFQFMVPGMPRTLIPRMPRQYNQSGVGSGVIVRSDGWILTNDHVVEGADRVTVRLSDGREFEGKVRRDFRSDLAVVKIDASGLTPAEFGDSDRVKVGQWAVAFGTPFELDDTMTVGIISARSRQKQISEGAQSRFYPVLLQTDASINPGNSGGPLVDIYGRVIGINVAINSPSGGSVGIGFAIPSNSARNVLDQLIEKGKVVRGFLGVGPRSLTPGERDRYGVQSGGVLIASVSEGTPAERAGLQVEDVVLRVGGKTVADEAEFRTLIAAVPPGKEVELQLRRSGREMTVRVTLAAPKDETAAAEPAQPSASTKIGLRVRTVTPEVAQQFRLDGVTSGVVVTEVQGGGPAEEAGLQPGDLITRANGRSVKTDSDVTGAVSAAKSGENIPFVIIREKARILVSVRVP